MSEKMKNNITHFLSIALMFALVGCGTAAATKEQPDHPVSQSTARTPFSTKNLPDMSMDEFVQIKNGMTYEQVTALVGSPGDLVGETGNPDNQQFYTLTYQFEGEGSMWGGAYAQLVFQDDKLTSKTQQGITLSEYEKIGKLE